jgi:hypothetical protein
MGIKPLAHCDAVGCFAQSAAQAVAITADSRFRSPVCTLAAAVPTL